MSINMKKTTIVFLVALFFIQFIPTRARAVSDLYDKATVPAYLIAEYPSGKIISGKNINKPNQIASLTKLFTAYTAVTENIDFNATTTYQKKKFTTGRVPRTAFKFSPGEQVKNEDVLNLMLVISNNSASRMLAYATGEKEKNFVEKMNKNAAALGLKNTSLHDTSGLNDKNVSTAEDMLKIFMTDLKDPTISDALGQPIYTFESQLGKKTVEHTIHNSDLIPKLYQDRSYDVLASKTGFTGKLTTMALLVQSQMDDKKYVIITLGIKITATDFCALINWRNGSAKKNHSTFPKIKKLSPNFLS